MRGLLKCLGCVVVLAPSLCFVPFDPDEFSRKHPDLVFGNVKQAYHPERFEWKSCIDFCLLHMMVLLIRS